MMLHEISWRQIKCLLNEIHSPEVNQKVCDVFVVCAAKFEFLSARSVPAMPAHLIPNGPV